MSDKDTKPCINCRWHRRSMIDPLYSECAHISAESKNLVTGVVEHGYCNLERAFGVCGEDGLFFEQAKSSENKQTRSNKTISKIFMLLGIR